MQKRNGRNLSVRKPTAGRGGSPSAELAWRRNQDELAPEHRRERAGDVSSRSPLPKNRTIEGVGNVEVDRLDRDAFTRDVDELALNRRIGLRAQPIRNLLKPGEGDLNARGIGGDSPFEEIGSGLAFTHRLLRRCRLRRRRPLRPGSTPFAGRHHAARGPAGVRRWAVLGSNQSPSLGTRMDRASQRGRGAHG
jgi:hypothetical protein